MKICIYIAHLTFIKASHTDTYPGQTEGAVETSSTQTIAIELSC